MKIGYVNLTLLFALLATSTVSMSSIIRTYVDDGDNFVPLNNLNAVNGTVVSNDMKNGSGSFFAQAGLGSMSLRGSSGAYNERTKLGAGFSINDLVFKRLEGFEYKPENITTAIHLTYAAEAHNPDLSSLSIGMGLGGSWDFFHTFNGVTYTNLLFLNGRSVIESRLFNININNVQTLNVNMEAIFRNTPILGGGQFGSMSSNLALGGSPVFVLPEGYTVNSLDGTIVDNYYVGFNPVSEVPVPPALLLFSTGLLGLIGFGKRKSAML